MFGFGAIVSPSVRVELDQVQVQNEKFAEVMVVMVKLRLGIKTPGVVFCRGQAGVCACQCHRLADALALQQGTSRPQLEIEIDHLSVQNTKWLPCLDCKNCTALTQPRSSKYQEATINCGRFYYC